MNILIIEDEYPAAQKLIRMLTTNFDDISIIGVLESVVQATNWFLAHKQPDLIFMDIQLEDGISFEIFENCSVSAPVIFTTAYNEYALKAFKVNSIDYLLKPIDETELNHAIQKYRKVFQPINNVAYQHVIESVSPKRRERLLIKLGQRYKSIVISDINCFYAKERSVFIHCKGNKIYPIDFSLEKVKSFIDERVFFRVSRNYIVNFHSIKDIVIYSSNRLKLCLYDWNDETILVSRERVADFKKWIDR